MASSRAPAAPADSTVIPGAEFQNANDLLQRAFHANPTGATAQIVFIAPHGQKITATRYQPVISGVVSKAARSPQVADATTPSQNGELSRDGSAAIAEINYTVVSDSLTTATTTMGVVALPAVHLRLGESGNAILPTSDTQRRAYDDISKAFGPGYNGQLAVVVTSKGTSDLKTAAGEVAKKISATPGVTAVSLPQLDAAGDAAVLNVIPATAPDAPQTTTLVDTLRAERPGIISATGATYLVTGLTAANIDIAAKVSSALLPYILAVVGLAILLLLLVFRSVLVPLKATIGFVLSLLAGLGALVAVFQWGWLGKILGVPATGPIQSFMPIFLVGIAFGLSMDYEVFLVSRIREAYAHGDQARTAVVSGFTSSGRVVVAAALIMMAVFAGFVTSNDILVKMIGFGLAVTILLDAFVVRMTIVPAVLALLGQHAWWLPRWLDRILPHLDIEGSTLAHQVTPEAAAWGIPGQAPASEPAGQGLPDR